jgi:hypothetical protein
VLDKNAIQTGPKEDISALAVLWGWEERRGLNGRTIANEKCGPHWAFLSSVLRAGVYIYTSMNIFQKISTCIC